MKAKKQKDALLNKKESEVAENGNVAFQELYELTQRKFLKQLSFYCDSMVTNRPYPRLFCIDFVDRQKLRFFDKASYKKSAEDSNYRPSSGKRETSQQEENSSKEENIGSNSVNEMSQCIRPICEFEEGWHLSDTFVHLLNQHRVESKFNAYLARVLNIIKSGNLANELFIFQTEHGQKLLKKIESSMAASLNQSGSDSSAASSLEYSYKELRAYYIKELEQGRVYSSLEKEQKTILDLKRCEMKNGKTVWLCQKHLEMTSARELSENVKNTSAGESEIDEKFLKYLKTVKTDLISFD